MKYNKKNRINTSLIPVLPRDRRIEQGTAGVSAGGGWRGMSI